MRNAAKVLVFGMQIGTGLRPTDDLDIAVPEASASDSSIGASWTNQEQTSCRRFKKLDPLAHSKTQQHILTTQPRPRHATALPKTNTRRHFQQPSNHVAYTSKSHATTMIGQLPRAGPPQRLHYFGGLCVVSAGLGHRGLSPVVLHCSGFWVLCRLVWDIEA